MDTVASACRLSLLFGEDKVVKSRGLEEAWRDLQAKLASGFPALFYGQIPYLLVYAAAGVNIQFGRLLPLGQVFYQYSITVLVGTVKACLSALASACVTRALYLSVLIFLGFIKTQLRPGHDTLSDRICMLDWATSDSSAWERSFQACLMFNLTCVAGRTCGLCPKCDAPCRSHLVVLRPGECRTPPGPVGEACS